MKKFFSTDSQTVLGYINNDARWFHIFVGILVQEIREHTTPQQWHYVRNKANPADVASHGADAQERTDSCLWWHNPDFLWNSSEHWNFAEGIPANPPNDREVNKVTVRTTQTQEPLSLLERLKYFSIWHRAKGVIAVSLCLQQRFRKVKGRGSEVSQCNQNNREERKKGTSTYVPIEVQDLQQVEQHIIKTAQNEIFRDEIQRLRSVNAQQQVMDQDATKHRNQRMKKSTSLHKLDPFIDENGLPQVGGRIRLSSLRYDAQHLIILPKEGHVTDLILCHFHQSVKHQGRGVTQNEIRSAGFWIIGGSSVVSHHISKCVSCRRLGG